MKKISVIVFITSGIVLAACSDIRREPGTIYMPDMAYSRAYETYAERDSLIFSTDDKRTDDKIFYNNMPVAGTIARGEELPFHIAKDAPGDTTNYIASKGVANPLSPLNGAQMIEAERQYLINCGICHGTDLKGNGPLYKDGKGPYPVAPKNLIADPVVSVMPEGQMFYSITYGKNMMGSYASQLTRDQRWAIIHYIKAKQGKTASPASTTTDSTASAKK
jgi:mono/diheme cytochrome c family protein